VRGAGTVVAVVVALCGCGDDPDQPDGGLGLAAELVVGSTSSDRTSFVEVADGDDVPLVSGSQGGFHVWTGLRVRGASGTLYLEREARRVSDGELVLRASTVVMELPDHAMADWWERPDGDSGEALPSFMCPTPIGLRVRDEPLRLRAQVLTPDEELLAEDEMVFVPRCPEGDEADFCAEICSG
jgi:hypothetical protein